jgi:DNA-binding NarL/FixJ family response regulator
MPARAPITVAISRFEDLLALGLRALLADDPSVCVVAQDIVHDRIGVLLRAHRPRVLILDVGALRNPAEVRQLSLEHPHTRLVLLGQQLSTTESAQLLAFGASACLAKDTQARDVRSAIHLASRGLQVMPRGAHEAEPAPVSHSLLTQREGEVLQLLRESEPHERRDRARAADRRRDRPDARSQHLPQARRIVAARADRAADAATRCAPGRSSRPSPASLADRQAALAARLKRASA